MTVFGVIHVGSHPEREPGVQIPSSACGHLGSQHHLSFAILVSNVYFYCFCQTSSVCRRLGLHLSSLFFSICLPVSSSASVCVTMVLVEPDSGRNWYQDHGMCCDRHLGEDRERSLELWAREAVEFSGLNDVWWEFGRCCWEATDNRGPDCEASEVWGHSYDILI